MLDFKKLNDPAVREESRLRREAESQRLEAIEREQRAAVELCERYEDLLTASERRFVRNVRFELARTGLLSPAQATWLKDIAARLTRA